MNVSVSKIEWKDFLSILLIFILHLKIAISSKFCYHITLTAKQNIFEKYLYKLYVIFSDKKYKKTQMKQHS